MQRTIIITSRAKEIMCSTQSPPSHKGVETAAAVLFADTIIARTLYCVQCNNTQITLGTFGYSVY